MYLFFKNTCSRFLQPQIPLWKINLIARVKTTDKIGIFFTKDFLAGEIPTPGTDTNQVNLSCCLAKVLTSIYLCWVN